MIINGDFINSYIRLNIDNIYKRTIMATQKNIGKEENFRLEIAFIINDIFKDLKIDLHINPEQEYSVAKGRIDSLYGNIIIEYKAPGKISPKNNSSNNENFVNQVKRQILGLSDKKTLQKETILGVIFDGYSIIYVRYRNDAWSISEILKVDKEALGIFFKRLLSLSIEKKALTIENLLQDFNSNSKTTKDTVRMLYNKCVNNMEYNKPKLLFEQWKLLFREVCGYDFDTLDLKIQKLKHNYEIEDKNIKIDCLIFSIHTYFALIIKFLSIEVLTYLSNKKQDSLNVLTVENQDKFKEQLIELESGWLYKKLGVSNFLEGDFFSWYIYLWDENTSYQLKTLIEEFRKYDYSSINLEPTSAKDLLKNVYHNLFPKELRHNLGEYYTPDWLAEMLINDMKIDYTSNKYMLDPTCGSGTFVILLIKNYINQNQNSMPEEQILNNIVKYIKGYDLNPLAVISARANYIIALGDLFKKRQNDIEIPIYLCDSMLTILEQKHMDRDCYVVSTKADKFLIPATLVNNGSINKILDILNEAVKLKYKPKQFIARIKKEMVINVELLETEATILEELFVSMYQLEQKGLDGIWTNVIKNSFAPIFQTKVDYIIGNPPWIVWQSLPEEYRESIKKYWYEYKVFEHKGLEARLGSAHDDLSVLMTYVIMDNFLKDNGKLGFIVNQNLFQSSGGGQGFRKLKIKDSIPIKIENVNDFVEVCPFKDLGADNKTASFIAIKNDTTVFPVNYTVWTKKTKGKINSDTPLESILNEKLSKKILKAQPIKEQEYNSSWIIGSEKDLNTFKKMLVQKESNYRARKGVDTSANAIFWIKIKDNIHSDKVLVANSPENSKKIIKYVDNVVLEKDLIYPLLRGKDVKKWIINSEYSIILPYKNDGKCIDVDFMKINYPKTYEYFYKKEHGFIDVLINRGIYTKHYQSLKTTKKTPEYALYDIGEYTFSKYKVVWKALASGIIATTISNINDKLIIPDHNLVMVPINDENEAYYLSGVLNTKIVSQFANAYISWFFSTHILENINIPKYNQSDEDHVYIANLSKKAHELSKNINTLSKAEQEQHNNICELLNIESKLNAVVEKILIKQ